MNPQDLSFRMKNVCAAAARCLVFLGLLVLPFTAPAADYYVKTPANGGNNANSGLGWNEAKATIGAAMALVDGDDSIYVAAGAYHEKVAFPQYHNIALRGGYPATGGAAQDPSSNPTIIDGTGLSASAPMISIPMQPNGTNGYFGIAIEGFTIRNGTRTGGGTAGIESYSLGVAIRRNIIENNQVTGTDGSAGGIYIFGPLNDKGKTTIEQNIVRNNAAAAVGGIYLEGAADKSERYIVYLVNNLIYGNQSTITDSLWNRGVGGVDIMYPASASIVNCTIADNTAAHPTNAIGGIHITGYPDSPRQKGIAAIANSIVWHPGGKDILATTDGVLWIAYSCVEDQGIGGTGVIHTNPQFAGPSDYHLTVTSLCKNAGNNMGTVLTGTKTTMYDIGYKNAPYNYTDAQVTWNWGDGIHDLKAQWQYYAALSSSYGHPVGRFFGTANANCTADPSDQQVISNMSTVDASTYSYATANKIGEYNFPFLAKQTIFWRGANGYYGAWRIDGIAVTTQTFGRLNVAWFFQTNGGPYFDSGIRTQDLEGNARPAETGYDMGAYEVPPPDTTPPTGSIAINRGAVCTKSAGVTLSLSASDPSGVAQMQFSNDNASWSIPADPYDMVKSWSLSPGGGTKTVYVKFKDNLDNWSSPYSATIFLATNPGDINMDGRVDIKDAILALQMTSGVIPSEAICSEIDANNDSGIGLAEAIYILQKAAGVR